MEKWGPFVKTVNVIYACFLSNHDIVPVWMYSGQVWGVHDKVLGKWTGAVGKVIEGKNILCLAYR